MALFGVRLLLLIASICMFANGQLLLGEIICVVCVLHVHAVC